MTGWECPKCGRVWAPYVQECLGPHTTAVNGTATPVTPQKCTTCGGTYFGGHTCIASVTLTPSSSRYLGGDDEG